MSINLVKGQKVSIGLTKIVVGLGWDPNEGTGYDFDLDASAVMINSQRKLPNENFFIFYNNLVSPDEAIIHTGDDPDGRSSDGEDDESLLVDLTKLDPQIQEILFLVTIDDHEIRRQNFGQVRNSYIRIYNEESGREIAKYELDEDFSIETGVEFGRLYKKDDEWKFEAAGIGYQADLAFFVSKYYDGDILK